MRTITINTLLLFLFLSLAVNAGTDVTNKFLRNADFASGPVTNVDIYGYGKDIVGDAVYGLQIVDGWSSVILSEDPNETDFPNSGMGGGVFAYGSTNTLLGYGISAPTSDKYGNSGTCLGFFAVWANGGYYYQDVLLPAGHYSISVPTYNAHGTKEYKSYIGFITKDGIEYVCQAVPEVSSWSILSTHFTLTHETRGRIVLGYLSGGDGSSNAPHLFFDKVNIEAEEWVDCTHHIQNPGFNEDISFNVDGSSAKPLTFAYEWSDNEGRSGIVYKAEDGSIYNEDKGGTQGYNAAGNPNWDGFKTHIKGWEITNPSDSALWIYYGCIPYDLEDGMMLLGGGDNSEGNVVEKPEELLSSDNTGVLFLKAGWQNACSYKQTIKNLPKANYKLSYYIRNTNIAKSSLYEEATNLCKVICNGVTFTDTIGFNSEGWINHTIDFIPVDSFSMEFGCKATDNYSKNNPILWIDEIRLYKIKDASDEEVDTAYQSLFSMADSLVMTMHFALDRTEFQQVIQYAKSNKDYVQLYQAILKATSSENKYKEIMSDDALIPCVASALDKDSIYRDSYNIVEYAYNKVIGWITSDKATYLEADNYVGKLNAYANIYAPVFIEAGLLVKEFGESKAETLLLLMESQEAELIANALLDISIVQQYADELKEAMNSLDKEKKCSTPTILYEKGKVSFDCDTDGVEFISEIKDSDIGTYNERTINLSVTYTINVYAKRDGFENSDVATATLCWIEYDPDWNDIMTDAAVQVSRTVLIQGQNGQITIQGVEDDMPINVYTIDGLLIGTAMSHNHQALVKTNIESGNILIVRLGEKSVKVVMR